MNWVSFGKAAHDLVIRMQKIDNDNYPEVLGSKFQNKLLEVVDSRWGTRVFKILEQNFANRKKPGCEKGTPVDCARTVATDALKKKLKEKMLVTSSQGLGVGGGTLDACESRGRITV
ncbi:hypothetical protein Droror1_Dr00008470 [Drosera rotundifolia]